MNISRLFFLRMRYDTEKVSKDKQTHTLCPKNFLRKIVPCMRYCGRIWQMGAGQWRRCHMAQRRCLLPACHANKAVIHIQSWGTRWRWWLRHCATSRKVAGSIPDGLIWIFYWHNPSGRTMALGVTQPLTEMSTRNTSWGVKKAGA
jgi:hypothetical protein